MADSLAERLARLDCCAVSDALDQLGLPPSVTGLPSLADDSGLEVDALGGAPGVLSARYAPTDSERIQRLLAALAGVAEEARTARFRCVVALAWPDGTSTTADGACEGDILLTPTGAGT